MIIGEREFKKYLTLYGAEMDGWPAVIRVKAYEALESSARLQELIEEERGFEGLLRTIEVPDPSDTLERRIVDASRGREQQSSTIRSFVDGYFWGFTFGRRAIALACALMIVVLATGFSIGFSSSPGTSITSQENLAMGDFLRYDGEIL